MNEAKKPQKRTVIPVIQPPASSFA
jgi:hypothetical protein